MKQHFQVSRCFRQLQISFCQENPRFTYLNTMLSLRMLQAAAPRCLPASRARRTFLQASAARLAPELPYHLVVGLPALSPTMETGALAEWYVQEGNKVAAGDVSRQREQSGAKGDEVSCNGFACCPA